MISEPPEHLLAQTALWLLAVAAVLTIAVAGAALAVHVLDARQRARRAWRWAQWKPHLMALISGERTPADFLAVVRPRQRHDALRLFSLYAIRLRGPGYRRLCAAAEPLLPLAFDALGARRAERRAFGAFTLGLLGREGARGPLVAALKDPSPEVAFAAARGLARMGFPTGIAPVIDALGRFEFIHTDAVASLLAHFGLRAGPPMMKALAAPEASAGSASGATRLALVRALQRLSYVPAADLAAQLLIDERQTPEVARALLDLLHDVGDPQHAQAVRPYADAEDSQTRLHALTTLARLSSDEQDAWRLAYALDSPDPWTALRAARGLREVGYGDELREQASGGGALAGFASLTFDTH